MKEEDKSLTWVDTAALMASGVLCPGERGEEVSVGWRRVISVLALFHSLLSLSLSLSPLSPTLSMIFFPSPLIHSSLNASRDGTPARPPPPRHRHRQHRCRPRLPGAVPGTWACLRGQRPWGSTSTHCWQRPMKETVSGVASAGLAWLLHMWKVRMTSPVVVTFSASPSTQLAERQFTVSRPSSPL